MYKHLKTGKNLYKGFLRDLVFRPKPLIFIAFVIDFISSMTDGIYLKITETGMEIFLGILLFSIEAMNSLTFVVLIV